MSPGACEERWRIGPARSTGRGLFEATPVEYSQLSGALRRFRHLLEDLIEAEARGLLSRRELLEALQELRDARLCGNEQVDVPEHPVEEGVRCLFRALVRIHAEVEDVRRPQHDERLEPDLQRGLDALLHE